MSVAVSSNPVRGGPAPRLGVALIILLSALTALDAMAIDMYLPAFPAIRDSFGVRDTAVQASLSAFLVGLAIGQLLCGPLLDRFGRRLPVLIGTVLFVAGSVLAAVAPSFPLFLLGRLLQAFGAAAGLAAPRVIVAELCNEREAARIFAILMQIFMVAPVVAPILGSYVLVHLGWPAIFWTLSFCGFLLLVWSIASLPETLPTAQRIARSPREVARVYLALGARRPFLLLLLSNGFVTGSLFAYLGGSSFALIDGYGLDATGFSYVFAANALGLVLAGRATTALLKRYQPRTILTGALLAHLIAVSLLTVATLNGGGGLLVVLPLLWLSLASLGITFGPITALTMARAGQEVGIGSGLLGAAQNAFGALSGVAVGALGGGAPGMALTMVLCALLAVLLNGLAAKAYAEVVEEPSS